MLTVYDKQLNKLGILDNAYNVPYERLANEIWQVSFSLPKNDPKNSLCQHFNYIDVTGASGRYYGKYRIMPTETKRSESDESITYQCEHVFATLLDDVIDGYLEPLINQPTSVQIERILDMQTTKHWQLGRCDFERFFQYAFENENGLLAPILSIPQPFNEPYLFTFDTQSYPWTLNLIRPSDDVTWNTVWGRDMLSFEETSDPNEIVNRIYPKGAGEGVNQLNIKDVNGGLPYVEDTDSINQWGLRPYVWIDRRFTEVETLKANAESLLSQWKDPKISFKVDSVDLSLKDEFKHLERPFYTVGEIVVGDTTYQGRIIGEKIEDVLSEEHKPQYDINNKLDDIATIQTDVERRQRVNEAYSQGATNILNTDRVDNADPTHPIKFMIRIPKDAINVNFMELTWETDYFRAYSQATKGGGSTVQSTSSGGGTTVTSSSGGGMAKSTASGGGTSETTNTTGSHRHRMFSLDTADYPAPTEVNLYGAFGDAAGTSYGLAQFEANMSDIYTYDAEGSHSHSVSIPNHSHSFDVPNHSHSVTIENHSHNITLPNHTHDIQYGIYEHGQLPTELEIKVDGNVLSETSLNGENVDLTPYLQKDSGGKIQRDRYAIVEIRPIDELAQITATIVWGVFIQSRKGVTL